MNADQPGEPREPTVGSRRAFLSGAGAAAVAGLAAACSSGGAASVIPAESESASEDSVPVVAATSAETAAPVAAVNFGGRHQAGILRDPMPAGLVAAFDVVTTDREELIAALQQLSTEIERIMGGEAAEQADEFLPPTDSGAVDSDLGTTGVAITLAVGASLFDERFGLADQRPSELTLMPRFFNDRLVRDDLSHGDLSLTITAPNQQAAVFALHQAVRVTERTLQLRWVQEGYNQLLPERPSQIAKSRNLMGFRDGTSNLDVTDTAVMDQHVWVQPGDNEPDWAIGGTYQAARIIRMLIEFWSTAALVRQEQIFGRHRDTGAPLGQTAEGDVPTFATDPSDEAIPRRAHMRLANPRTPNAGRILRRGFSYLNGVDASATMDQGLLFLCYQRALTTGFLEVQSRLDGEPLEDYIKPLGGGFFFVVPGPGDSGGWLGQSLFT